MKLQFTRVAVLIAIGMIAASHSVAVVATQTATSAVLQSRDNFKLAARTNLPDVIEHSFGPPASHNDGFDDLVSQSGDARSEHMDNVALAPTLQYHVLFGAKLKARPQKLSLRRPDRLVNAESVQSVQVTNQGGPAASGQAFYTHEPSQQHETLIEAHQPATAGPRLDFDLNVALPTVSSPLAASKGVESQAPKRKYYANLRFRSKKKKTGASDDPDWLSPAERARLSAPDKQRYYDRMSKRTARLDPKERFWRGTDPRKTGGRDDPDWLNDDEQAALEPAELKRYLNKMRKRKSRQRPPNLDLALARPKEERSRKLRTRAPNERFWRGTNPRKTGGRDDPDWLSQDERAALDPADLTRYINKMRQRKSRHRVNRPLDLDLMIDGQSESARNRELGQQAEPSKFSDPAEVSQHPEPSTSGATDDDTFQDWMTNVLQTP